MYVFILRLPGLFGDCQDVEMDFAVQWQVAVFQPDEGSFTDPLLLVFDHRILGQPIFYPASVFNFNKTEGFVFTYDDIDFAEGASKITVYYV